MASAALVVVICVVGYLRSRKAGDTKRHDPTVISPFIISGSEGGGSNCGNGGGSSCD